ncbi:hypothetical protein GOV05_01960 [Candidatus Woesearchaeota archaeon]|nr:hypothetical protein [Candidatus Woesearchaeota archaeon]
MPADKESEDQKLFREIKKLTESIGPPPGGVKGEASTPEESVNSMTVVAPPKPEESPIQDDISLPDEVSLPEEDDIPMPGETKIFDEEPLKVEEKLEEPKVMSKVEEEPDKPPYQEEDMISKKKEEEPVPSAKKDFDSVPDLPEELPPRADEAPAEMVIPRVEEVIERKTKDLREESVDLPLMGEAEFELIVPAPPPELMQRSPQLDLDKLEEVEDDFLKNKEISPIDEDYSYEKQERGYKPIYVKVKNYERSLSSISSMKLNSAEFGEILFRIENIVDSQLTKLKTFHQLVEDLQRKIIFLDNFMFEEKREDEPI